MDTGTHLVVGLGLAGLAYADPVVAADPATSTAVLIGTVLGSQAPDADGFLRLKSNASYIRNHRGASHSIPAILIWTALITGLLMLMFDDLPWFHVTFWVFVAVAFHVFSDLFNSYGTQLWRPFSHKWVSWNIIHIFDPFIFSLHVLGILLWTIGAAPPEVIFSTIYILLAAYYVWRTIVHRSWQQRIASLDREHASGDQYTIIPTISLNAWNVVKRQADGGFQVGDLKNGRLRWVEQVYCDDHPAVEASKQDPAVSAFLYFTSFACAEMKRHSWGYEVRWVDVRYRHRKQYPFVAVVYMDLRYRPLNSYVGWLSDNRIQKKLRIHAG